MKYKSLEYFQLEIILCYHSQNNIPSFVDELLPETEKRLYEISLSVHLNNIIAEDNFITEEEFANSGDGE